MGHGGPGREPVRVGVRYLLLVVLGSAGAVVLARYFHLGAATTAVTVLLGLAPTYIAWAAFRADRAEAAALDLDTVARQLAMAVKTQWDAEVAVRRVNDPYPLPVAWQSADDDLAEPWPLLVNLARAWPGGPPGDPARWPHDAAGLAGAGAQIGEIFTDRVPTRRLVILGEPGAGKSVLLIRLLHDLIERRTDTSPVPVLFSLASWNPRQPLKTWLADQLRRTHPGLTTPASSFVATTATNTPGDLAQALLEAGRILPLLDGLDELPPAWHPVALDSLNRALSARQPVVLASRAAPYRDALTRPGTTVRLNGAAAIHLLPLSTSVAADYLRRDAGGPHSPAARRWDAVTAHLGTAAPVGQALNTPLGLFLARVIYNPRPGTTSAPVAPHPDELCDTTAFPDRTSIDAHLFRAFIPAAYTPDHHHPPRWSTPQAHRTFVFLARFLQNQRAGSPDLAWWQLRQALPPHSLPLAVGITFGPAFGLAAAIVAGLTAGFTAAIGFGIAVGITAGLGFGLVVAVSADRYVAPATRLRSSPLGIAFGIVAGIVAPAAVLLASLFTIWLGHGITDGDGAGLVAGLTVTIGVGIAVGLTVELEAQQRDLTSTTGPVTQLALDRRAFIAAGITAGLPFGIGVEIAAGITAGLGGGTAILILGLVVALPAGLTAGLTAGARMAWPYFVMVRAYLAIRRKVPPDLMAFLQDAHEHRGVLRQVGAVYQFRHIDLQRHLAQQQP